MSYATMSLNIWVMSKVFLSLMKPDLSKRAPILRASNANIAAPPVWA
nr:MULTISPECIES: hypothetical protein [Xenorhabdus]